ncbi:twinkle mtDNA helicase-like [Dysidea avara]|uniref:twinkle mtDNA helicase-like n=1 Tax=Dysidea avara TaxID=196820 RepID=UPI00331EDBCC
MYIYKVAQWSKRILKSVNYNLLTTRQLTVLRSPNAASIKTYLDEKQFVYREGHTSFMIDCPICDKTVKEKNGVVGYGVHVNKTTGSVVCQPCKMSGSWTDFSSWIDNRSQSKPVTSQPPTNYKLLNSVSAAEKFWSQTLPWKMSLVSVMNRAMKLFGSNKISSETLEKFNVHTVVGKFTIANNQEIDQQCLAYPFYNDKNIARVKVESTIEQANRKTYFEPRHGLHGLFGWNLIKESDKEVVLTASEFDAMAVHQATEMPALSLPNGCLNLSPELLPQLEQFEKIILWLGNDPQSKQATNQFAKKLNMKRCYAVTFHNELDIKNAVHALSEGYNLKETIESARPIAHNKIMTFPELRDDVYSDYLNAEKVAGVKWQRFPGLTKTLKGHRPGEVTILTGPTGSGKTTLVSEMSLDLCQQGVTTLWGSFEIKNVRLVKTLLNQLSGIKLEKSLSQYPYWADQFEQLPLYFMNFYGTVDIDTVIEVMTHAAYIYDIQHVVIDNLQFMIGSAGIDDKYSLQNKAIAEFRKFAFMKNVHVTIVIHPRKEDSHVELQTASISGSAKASQEADNILILQKLPKQPKYLQVAKNRFDGDLGRMILDFHKESSTISGYFKKRSSTSEQDSSNISQNFDRKSPNSEQDLSSTSQSFRRSSISEQEFSSNISQNFNRTSSNLEQEVENEYVDDIKLKSKHSTGDGAIKPLTSLKHRKSQFWKPKPFTHFSKLKTSTKK